MTKNNATKIDNLINRANKGNAQAQFELGERYCDGKGVEQDYQKAVEWLTKASDQGHAKAMFSLGWCYGKGCGVPKDVNKGFELSKQSAELGFKDAQYYMGTLYQYGHSIVPIDIKQAIYWYKLAEKQGDHDAWFELYTIKKEGKNKKGLFGWLKGKK